MTPDIIVIGAGAIGASTALHLARRGAKVTLLEKEAQPAQHQSGRNSGVIHAGYNLKPGSLKARYCVEGSRRLRQYCREKDIPMFQGGILIVARTETERSVLAELKTQADGNGVQAIMLSREELKKIEPHAEGIAALQAPEGASFDTEAYVRSLLAEATALGAQVTYGVEVTDSRETAGNVTVRTTNGSLTAAVLVNCAGLQADRVAGPVAADMRVIPFRGYYAELVPSAHHLVNSHIYAAPDLAFPFLGIHLSRKSDGRVIVGPGAMLAFGREAYHFFGGNLRDLWQSLTWPGFRRMCRDSRFLELVRSETLKSLSLRYIWKEARLLVPELKASDLVRSYAGNRAQMVSRDGKLVDDIVVRDTGRTVHVLNAVSPGLTCSLPFGEEIANRCLAKLERGPLRSPK
ncbi:MAG: L-2-hydroxyglutarate oxidase [Gemmatimonadetes bacterium]|nr:L-2-hydroxyglutarate oxidase [Gemmatimonadota bacterium]